MANPAETWEALVERITEGGTRMVPLKAVLEACVSTYDLGDWERYMPWRFSDLCTAEECTQLDRAMNLRQEL